MIYTAVQLIESFSAGPASQPRVDQGGHVVQEVLADLKMGWAMGGLRIMVFVPGTSGQDYWRKS